MTEKVHTIYKKPGQTPLEAITEAKNLHPEWRHLPVTYAGRLDPLAEGVLLLLVGDECMKKDEYLALPKEYEVTILFGFATDTYDLMGKVTQTSLADKFERSSDLLAEESDGRGQTISNLSASSVLESETSFNFEVLNNILSQFTGRIHQAYPPYSSRTVGGKPLYQWAREGKISEIIIPSHDVFVESIEVLGRGEMPTEELHTKIKDDIARVSGDFRQEEILSLWDTALSQSQDKIFPTVTLRIRCGSGVYVRALAHELGHALGVPALALQIIRTKVGDYSLPKE